MDELFNLPPTPVAMPRAYWLGGEKRVLTSAILVVQPSQFEYSRIEKAITAAKSNEYDMEIMNTLYQNSALVLPHRPYIMITSELYELDHAEYLGNHEEIWDPEAALRELKLIHFSDWPVPKVCNFPYRLCRQI
jgi:5-formaminoimidazole-4-carboxamide-1-beta-D-ribofuranosyl 5'-monophosphate synthetase